ncbi:MAG TPA: SAM-dependent methyltransferase [Casimicrobiaceae bacterium]|nr:SAM-dependent methyltransferase [Casimicrobiaceae bacterium]
MPHRAHCRTRNSGILRHLVVIGAAALPLWLLGCANMPGEDPSAQAARYQAVIASPLRTDGDHRLDASRKPAQFLPFTQVKPGMSVMDVSAGGGYTSQLLALAVEPSGKLWAQTPRPNDNLRKRLADHPQPDFVIVERPFEDPVPPDQVGKLDLITLVNNYHDITYLPVDRAKMNAHLLAALKPGGHFVIVDHSGRPGTGISEGRTLHRIDEAVVRKELADAGFVLEAEGDFLRNPDDKRDDSSNSPRVPTDKFALRFVKPR